LLRSRLSQIDAEAFGDPESWWSVILEQWDADLI
jgi:hypothetical protein